MPFVMIRGLAGSQRSNIPMKFYRLITDNLDSHKAAVLAKHGDAEEAIVLHGGVYDHCICVGGNRFSSGRTFAEAWYSAASLVKREAPIESN